MTWLLGQLWPLLLVSFLLGAATVVLWGQRRQTVEVWEDVPVPPPPAEEPTAVAEPEDAEPASVGTPVPVDADDPDSPFPIAAASDPKPWEAEELWSRPARLSASGEARRPKDEWTEAAENWRSWADEATGRGYAGGGLDGPDGAGGDVSERDRDLFAADRDLFAADREEPPAAEEEPVDVFPGGASTSYDDFPYARPVEAAPAAETMDPMDGTDEHEMTDDEREAAEIRRMRAQAQHDSGDTGSTDGDPA